MDFRFDIIFALFSLITALIIALGRQLAVFGKVHQALWFFSNYEFKRLLFSILSIIFGVCSLILLPSGIVVYILLSISAVCIVFAFLFDFRYIFPEVQKVERRLGSDITIDGDTEVIGLSDASGTVAYPLDVVIPRHIINDHVGNQNSVISYCAICRSALIFSAEIEGEKLYFTVAGVWRRNMIMIDDQTKSLWQQATGECIYGRHKGKRLELLSGENTRWKSWIEKHPYSEFAYKCTEARKGYLSRKRMMNGLDFITPKLLPPGFTDLAGLPPREVVFGVSFRGIARAYPASSIEGLTTFEDQFLDAQLIFEYDKYSDYLTAHNPETRTQVIVEKHWWLGWKEFHPDTEIWRG